MKKLSILIPVYNEERTIILLLNKINSVELNFNIEKEFIIVDDASTDQTATLVKEYISHNPEHDIKYSRHDKNKGKGACLRNGIHMATGDFILIQDADLEYDPSDYNALLEPVVNNKADVVYGSRFIGGQPHRILFFWHSLGNKILTFFSNMMTNLNLTDMENGYKVFRSEIIKSIQLEENRFGFEPEITAKISRIPDIRIYEVGIAYYGRTYKEGKKINWKDGFRAVYSIIKYNLFSGEKTFQADDSMIRKTRQPGLLLIALFLLAATALIFLADGTGDEGDSIMHYLYARHSWQNPEFFFNHWAKPVFVLLSSPFSQFGMEGMKFFNVIVSTLTLYLAFLTAKELKLPNAWLVPFCMIFSPWLLIVTLSGLTEPLFAFWMMAGIYLLLKRKWIPGLLWLSFLPFVRSEGLIILCVLLVYLLFKKKYRFIPLLIAGHAVYAFAGYYVHYDLLWVFNTLSYAVLHSAYGQGEWMHFVKHMPEVIGKVLVIFLLLGLLYGFLRKVGRFFMRQHHAISHEELFLVYGIFIAYFLGHTVFWALGIFNSFGLIRVMVGVLPLIAIICARGFNFAAYFLKAGPLKYLVYLALLLIATFPFMESRYSWNWKRDFSLKADQLAQQKMAEFIKTNFPDHKNQTFYYEAVYVSVVLDKNYFDSTEHKRLRGAFEAGFTKGSYIVWDDWFAPVEGFVTEEMMENDPRFEFLKSFEEKDFWNVERKVKLYRVR